MSFSFGVELTCSVFSEMAGSSSANNAVSSSKVSGISQEDKSSSEVPVSGSSSKVISEPVVSGNSSYVRSCSKSFAMSFSIFSNFSTGEICEKSSVKSGFSFSFRSSAFSASSKARSIFSESESARLAVSDICVSDNSEILSVASSVAEKFVMSS